MKKIILLFVLSMIFQIAFSQSQYTDSLLQKLTVEKDEDKKFDLIMSFYDPGWDRDPSVIIESGQKLLKQVRENNDIIKEASAYSFLGSGYRLSGNPTKALEYHQKALSLAEKSKNFSLLAMVKNQMTHIYKDREEDWPKALKLYLSALDDAEKGKNEVVKAWPIINIGVIYLGLNKVDSALKYLQKSYELSLQINKTDLPYILSNLGGVHSKMGNSALAVTYYNMGIQKAIEYHKLRQLSWSYAGLAEHYQGINETDSCKFYAKKAVEAVLHTPFFYVCIKPAKLLSEIYQKNNCDSTLKYATLYKTANDSLYNNKANQQIQLMTFDEELRQQELASEKLKEEKQRKQNIQFALIAFGIITFIVLFLLFSRSIVANERFISFFSILGLLVVFEFINLLIHPWLAHFTHESPVLMLLALVLIASLLIPLHHRLEHWIKEKMIEKNKAIRLEAAKKTIEELENKQTS